MQKYKEKILCKAIVVNTGIGVKVNVRQNASRIT